MNLAQVGVNIRLGEFRPDLAWDFRRTVTFDAQQETGLLGRLAHSGQREGARKIGIRLGHSLQKLFLSVGMQLADRRHFSIKRFDPTARKNKLPRHEFMTGMPATQKNLRLRTGPVDQHQRCGVAGLTVRK
jgi:hypothetical protein